MALKSTGKGLSSLTGIVVLAAVLWMLLNLFWVPHVGRFSCSYEPWFLGVAQADSGGCPESIRGAAEDAEWAADRWEEIKGQRRTAGLFYDEDGQRHAITSGDEKDADAQRAREALHEAGVQAAPDGSYPAATHVEVKVAASMRAADAKAGVVVINHPGGPCPGPYGCRVALTRVLPDGASLVVWWSSDQGMRSQVFRGGAA